MRFLDELLRTDGVWSHSASQEDLDRWQVLRRVLDDVNTKRILFDSKQAALFDDLGEAPPKPEVIYPPFDTHYLEFTEPIALALQEPDQYDYARAMLCTTQTGMFVPIGESGKAVSMAQCTMFLVGKDNSLVDRSWKLVPKSDICFVRMIDALSDPDPSTLPPGTEERLESYMLAGHVASARHVGWWEQVVLNYNGLLQWIWAYMMAKSVTIVPETVSRQQRRWMERKHIVPKPWHLVKVEPKFGSHRPSGEEPSYRHSYRYDVIGHLRFNQHRFKNADGQWTYRDMIEWVPPHMRGLANELYIPKTYKVEAGKTIATKQMQRWTGQGK